MTPRQTIEVPVRVSVGERFHIHTSELFPEIVSGEVLVTGWGTWLHRPTTPEERLIALESDRWVSEDILDTQTARDTLWVVYAYPTGERYVLPMDAFIRHTTLVG